MSDEIISQWELNDQRAFAIEQIGSVLTMADIFGPMEVDCVTPADDYDTTDPLRVPRVKDENLIEVYVYDTHEKRQFHQMLEFLTSLVGSSIAEKYIKMKVIYQYDLNRRLYS